MSRLKKELGASHTSFPYEKFQETNSEKSLRSLNSRKGKDFFTLGSQIILIFSCRFLSIQNLYPISTFTLFKTKSILERYFLLKFKYKVSIYTHTSMLRDHHQVVCVHTRDPMSWNVFIHWSLHIKDKKPATRKV